MRIWLVLPLSALVLGGCGSKDNVALSGSISEVALSIEQVTLGTRLSGSFRLELELGAQAPAAASVSLGRFSLLAADQSEVAVLQLIDPAAAFPLDLEPGDGASAVLQLDDADPVAVERDSVCQSLTVAGSVTDEAANGRVTGVSSAAFVPGGC